MIFLIYSGFVLLGAIVGALHLVSLKWSLKGLATKKISLVYFSIFFIVKLVVIAAAFYLLLTKFGWKSLLPFLAGMIIFNLTFAGYQTKAKHDRA